jgi:thiol:disulfide interchange protein DsbG
MRMSLVPLLLVLSPALGLAAPGQCAMPDGPGVKDPARIPAGAVPPAPELSTAAAQAPAGEPTRLPVLSASEIDQAPVLKHIADSGAELRDIGTGHGIRSVVAVRGNQFIILQLAPDGQAVVAGLAADLTVEQLKRAVGDRVTALGTTHGLAGYFVRNGQEFQVLYATPDGERLIPGVMWDSTGRNVTRDQVTPIAGTIPTVEIANDGGGADRDPAKAPPLASTGSALAVARETVFGVYGDSSAPRLWMFIDPKCPFSIQAMARLQPLVEAKKVQLAVIPLAVIDYENQGESTKSALAMLAKAPTDMVAAWRSGDLNGAPDPSAELKLRANMAAAGAVGVRGTPTLLWQKPDGTEGRVDGLPADIIAVISSIGVER